MADTSTHGGDGAHGGHGETAAHAADAAHGAGHAAAHGGGGAFPPFDPTHFTSQLFWLALIFGALYFVMSRIALPRIGAVIEERRDKIADDLDRAAELKLESEAALKSYERALADAKAKAVAIAAETRDTLDQEISEMQADLNEKLEEKLEAAERRIAESKEQALAHVRDIAGDTANAIVRELGGAGVGDAAASVSAAIDAELAS
ncbi:MAG: F0F1 ATP synthase subunit B [Pseudomonadota bacterium]